MDAHTRQLAPDAKKERRPIRPAPLPPQVAGPDALRRASSSRCRVGEMELGERCGSSGSGAATKVVVPPSTSRHDASLRVEHEEQLLAEGVDGGGGLRVQLPELVTFDEF